jgi:hypothetical protein
MDLKLVNRVCVNAFWINQNICEDPVFTKQMDFETGDTLFAWMRFGLTKTSVRILCLLILLFLPIICNQTIGF